MFLMLLGIAIVAGCSTKEDTIGPGPSSIDLFINEFIASNESTVADEHGDYDDWFEIYNATDDSIDIGGMYVSDDVLDRKKSRIPATDPSVTTIPAGGFLLIWCDKEPTEGLLHVDFKLSGDGEAIILVEDDGVTVIDELTYTEQTTDVSYGRIVDGGDAWTSFSAPTPGASNGSVPPNTPPTIASVVAMPAQPVSTDTVTVTAVVTDNDTVASVSLLYNAGTGFDTLSMSAAAGDSFLVRIPPQGDGLTVLFYLTAVDNEGDGSVYPAGAPANTLSYTVGIAAPDIFINEFLADNDAVIVDPDLGEFVDWIELHNAGDVSVNLSGWTLTDDFADPTQWQFPPGVSIAAGGFLLVWADGEDMDTTALHTNFKLKAGGEEIGLYNASGAVIDTLVYSEQATDISYGRVPDGGVNWATFSTPTPGASNE